MVAGIGGDDDVVGVSRAWCLFFLFREVGRVLRVRVVAKTRGRAWLVSWLANRALCFLVALIIQTFYSSIP